MVGVEDLVGAQAGHGRAGDIAHGVAAGLAAGQAVGGQALHDAGHVLQLDEVDLDGLAGSDVADAQRGPIAANIAQGAGLSRGHQAAGDLDAHHLHILLALAIRAVDQAERLEFFVRDRAVAIGFGLGFKMVDLAPDDIR